MCDDRWLLILITCFFRAVSLFLLSVFFDFSPNLFVPLTNFDSFLWSLIAVSRLKISQLLTLHWVSMAASEETLITHQERFGSGVFVRPFFYIFVLVGCFFYTSRRLRLKILWPMFSLHSMFYFENDHNVLCRSFSDLSLTSALSSLNRRIFF